MSNSRLPAGTYDGDPRAPWNQYESDEPRFDKYEIHHWLGTDDKLEEAIETILAIANEEYSAAQLIKDLEETFGKD